MMVQARKTGAKASSSPFDRAIDASRAARLAALEVAREMRMEARNEMKAARSHRKRAQLQNERLAVFVENCRRLGINMDGAPQPHPGPDDKSQSQKETSYDNTNEGQAKTAATSAISTWREGPDASPA